MNIICWTSRSLSICLSVKRRKIPKWNSREKKLPTANFSFRLFPFPLFIFSFSWFFLPAESFLNSIFLWSSFSLPHSPFCLVLALCIPFLFPGPCVLCVCVCVCASFSSLSNGSHSTGPFKETTPRLRYPKTKHTFSTFRRIHASLFVSQLLIFLFRSVFHLRSTSYIATGPNCSLNNTIAQAQCTYMIIYVTFWYRFLLLACIYLFVCRAFS